MIGIYFQEELRDRWRDFIRKKFQYNKIFSPNGGIGNQTCEVLSF